MDVSAGARKKKDRGMTRHHARSFPPVCGAIGPAAASFRSDPEGGIGVAWWQFCCCEARPGG